jgi:hypothetical protein
MIFDISTLKGLQQAEKYKATLENTHYGVRTSVVGVNKISIEGVD